MHSVTAAMFGAPRVTALGVPLAKSALTASNYQVLPPDTEQQASKAPPTEKAKSTPSPAKTVVGFDVDDTSQPVATKRRLSFDQDDDADSTVLLSKSPSSAYQPQVLTSLTRHDRFEVGPTARLSKQNAPTELHAGSTAIYQRNV